MTWEKNHPGDPIAKLREGTPDEVWVTFDRIDGGYVCWGDWSFHRGDAFLFRVPRKAIGDTPSREVLQALLEVFEGGVRAGEFRGFREGKRCLQRDLRRTLGIPAPSDDAEDMLQSVHDGVVSRAEAERTFGRSA